MLAVPQTFASRHLKIEEEKEGKFNLDTATKTTRGFTEEERKTARIQQQSRLKGLS